MGMTNYARRDSLVPARRLELFLSTSGNLYVLCLQGRYSMSFPFGCCRVDGEIQSQSWHKW